MDLFAIALQGLNQADTQLEQAATAIASQDRSLLTEGNVDIVDLSAEIVALSSAKNLFATNLTTLKVADDLQKNAIDLKT